MCGYHAAYSSYILPLTLACYRLRQSRDSDVVAEDHHMFYKCYFAAVWNSLDVPAPGDCISAINPKVQHRPMFLPAIPFLVEPIVRLMAAGFTSLSTRAHKSILSIVQVFNSVQAFSVESIVV